MSRVGIFRFIAAVDRLETEQPELGPDCREVVKLLNWQLRIRRDDDDDDNALTELTNFKIYALIGRSNALRRAQ